MRLTTLILALLSLSLLLVGCGGNGGSTTTEMSSLQAIESQLTTWSRGVNDRDLSSVMSTYSAEYLHDGFDYEDEQFGWAFLFGLHDRIYVKINELHIPSYTIVDNYADLDIHFNLNVYVFDNGEWTKEVSKESLKIPMRKENGKWTFYGNQEEETRSKKKAIWDR